jgi:hypothetical protein
MFTDLDAPAFRASAPGKRQAMKFTERAVLDVPYDQVDLERWLFTLSDSDYQTAAHGHLGAGHFTWPDGARGMINVERAGALSSSTSARSARAAPTRRWTPRRRGPSSTTSSPCPPVRTGR